VRLKNNIQKKFESARMLLTLTNQLKYSKCPPEKDAKKLFNVLMEEF